MIAHIKQKVKEGKLVKVDLEYDEVITGVKITGDFFMHPEETLEEIEKGLLGLKRDATDQTIAHRIREIMEVHDTQMVGLGPESLAKIIKEGLG